MSPALERRREDHNDMIPRRDAEAGLAILAACGPPPGQRHQPIYFGGREYYINLDDARQFKERLSDHDGSWLAGFEPVLYVVIWVKLLDANSPDPTNNEIELYLRIREGVMFHGMDKNNDARNGTRRVDHQEEIVKRLDEILTPVPIPEDNPECMICYEPFGKASEGGTLEHPVQLACGHVYGRQCLEIWVQGFVPGSGPFSVCTLCRKDFDILSLRDATIGIGSRATPWWLLLFWSIIGVETLGRRYQVAQYLRA
jgi:hypothetical protein